MAETPKRPTQARSKSRFRFDPFQTAPKDLPQTQTEPESTSSEPETARLPRASREKTNRATQKIQPSDQMRDLISRMKDLDQGVDQDQETNVVPYTEPQDLPTAINKHLVAAGVQTPDWHVVSNLPGNMKRSIMVLGKSLFGSLTKTPVSDIVMIGNVLDQGPNTSREINAVAAWLKKNGKDLGSGDIDFSKVMPGYQAKTYQYSLAGARWLLVQDDFGQYIYTWPENHSLDAGTVSKSLPNTQGKKARVPRLK